LTLTHKYITVHGTTMSKLQDVDSEVLELPVLGQTYMPGQAVESFTWTVHVTHFSPFQHV